MEKKFFTQTSEETAKSENQGSRKLFKRDVLLLVLIVFFAALAMMAFTIFPSSTDGAYAASDMSELQEKVDEAYSSKNMDVVQVGDNMYNVSSGLIMTLEGGELKTTQTHGDGTEYTKEEAKESKFNNADDWGVNDAGQFYIDYKDGSRYTEEEGEYSYQTMELNFDDEVGNVPLNDDVAVDRIVDDALSAKSLVAYADARKAPTIFSGWTYNSNGSWRSQSIEGTGKDSRNGTKNASLNTKAYIDMSLSNNSSWYKYMAASQPIYLQCVRKISFDWGKGGSWGNGPTANYGANWASSGGSTPSGNTKLWYVDTGSDGKVNSSTGKLHFVCWITYKGRIGGGKKDKGDLWCKVNGGTVKICHKSNATRININKDAKTRNQAWKTERAVTVRVSSDLGIRSYEVQVYRSGRSYYETVQGLDYRNVDRAGSFRAQEDITSPTTRKFIKLRCRNYMNNWGSWQTITAFDSRIDCGAPKVPTIQFYKGDKYSAKSSFSTGNEIKIDRTFAVNGDTKKITILVKVSDTGKDNGYGVGAASGIQSVKLSRYKVTGGKITGTLESKAEFKMSYVTSSHVYSKQKNTFSGVDSAIQSVNDYSSGKFYCPNSSSDGGTTAEGYLWLTLNAKDAVGRWKVECSDYAGQTSSKVVTFTKWDGAAPTISDLKIVGSSGTTKAFTNNGKDWFNEKIRFEVTVKDTTDADLNDDAGICLTNSSTYNKIKFSINNVEQTFGLTHNLKVNGVTAKNEDKVKEGVLYNNDLCYDWMVIKGFNSGGITVTVKDVAGNEATYTKQLITNESTNLKARLDTVSPAVVSVNVPSGWQNGEALVTVKSRDYAFNNTVSYVGLNKTNNGSGIAYLLFFTDKACTKPLPVYKVTSQNGVRSYTQDSGNPHKVVVDTAKEKIAEITTTVSIRYDSCRTDFDGSFYVVAVDYCNNRSDGKKAEGATAYTTGTAYSYAGKNYPNISASYKNNKYHISQGIDSGKKSGLKRDTYIPQIVVRTSKNTATSANNVLAASNKTTQQNKSVTNLYTYPWSKAANTKFYIYFYYGCSGGKLTYGTLSKTVSQVTRNVTVKNGKRGDGGQDLVLNPKSAGERGTSTDYGTYSCSNSGYVSNSTYFYDCVEVNITKEGLQKIDISFKSGSGIVSSTVTINVRMDRTAPDVKLVGFRKDSTQVIGSVDNLRVDYTPEQLVSLATSSQWLYPENSQGYTAVFRISDGNEGTITTYTNGVAGERAALGTASGLNVSSGATNVDDHLRKYGVSGTSSTQNISGANYTYNKIGETAYTEMGTNKSFAYEMKYMDADGYVYSYIETGKPVYLGIERKQSATVNNVYTVTETKVYLVQVKMFSREKMNSWTSNKKVTNFTTGATSTVSNGRTLRNENGYYNVDANTYLRYRLAVSDYIGNVGYAVSNDTSRPNNNLASSTNEWEKREWSNSVLRYFVDPFESKILNVEFYTYESNAVNWKDDLIETYGGLSTAELAGTFKPYTMTTRLDTGWTSKIVMAQIIAHSGLSGHEAEYRYQVVEYNDARNASNLSNTYMGLNPHDVTGGGRVLTKSTDPMVSWIVFDNTETKDIQVGIGLKLKYKRDDNTNVEVSRTALMDGYTRMIVKQDVEVPIIEQVILMSEPVDPELNNDLIFLTFTAKNASPSTPSSPVYEFTVETEQALSPHYKAGRNLIYTPQKLYVVIKVNDIGEKSKLHGSGVKSIIYDSHECMKLAEHGFSLYYVSREDRGLDGYIDHTYANDSKGEKLKGTIKATDNELNSCTALFGGGNASGSEQNSPLADEGTDTTGFKVFPVLDVVNVYIKLDDATTATSLTKPTGITSVVKTEEGGLNVFDKTRNNTTGSQVYRLNGKLMNQFAYLNISYNCGISGLTLYIRRKDYNTDVNENANVYTRLTGLNYYTAAGILPWNYDFAGNGWGYYLNGDWETNYDAMPYVWDDAALTSTSTAVRINSFSVKYDVVSCKENLEIMAVSGSGKYYVIDAGALFIDMETPVIHLGMTTFAMQYDANIGTEVEYDQLKAIWDTDVGLDYTNAITQIYYFATDGASGLNESTVKSNGTLLTKVLVKGVPVYTLGGVPVTVRNYLGEDNLVITTDSAGRLMFNGYYVYKIKNAEELLASPVKANECLTFTSTAIGGMQLWTLNGTSYLVKRNPSRPIITHNNGVLYIDGQKAFAVGEAYGRYSATTSYNVTYTSEYGITVYKINGTPVAVERTSATTPVVSADSQGYVAINGKRAYILNTDEVRFSSLFVTGSVDMDLYFFRTLATTQRTFDFTATDISTNSYVADKIYEPRVDRTELNINLTARNDMTDSTFTSYTGAKFTNKNVEMRWQMRYGASGFEFFRYVVTDMLKTEDNVRTYILRIPQIVNDGDIKVVNYYDANGVYTKMVIGTSADTFKLSVKYRDRSYFWCIENVQTRAKYEDIPADTKIDGEFWYGSPAETINFNWELNGTYLYCYKTVIRGNILDRYEISGYNYVRDDYTVENVRPVATGAFNIKIDITPPVIDANSGNMRELNSLITDDNWHSVQQSVRVDITDNLSGLDKTANKLSSTVSIEKATLSFTTIDRKVSYTYYLIANEEDGLYRAYQTRRGDVYTEIVDLVYLLNTYDYDNFSLRAEDEAGNVTTLDFYPRVDDNIVTIENVQYYYADTEEVYDVNNPTLSWLKMQETGAVKHYKLNWTSDYVTARIKVRYLTAGSGYVVQVRKGNTQTENAAVAGTWETIPWSELTIYSQEEDGDYTIAEVNYKIGENVTYLYSYHNFRVLSEAQHQELTKYADYSDSNKMRSENIVESNVAKIRTKLEPVETKFLGMTEFIATPQAANGSNLVAIDKMTPEMTIRMTDLTDSSNYGSANNATEIKVADPLWSTKGVTMNLTFNYNNEGESFISGLMLFVSYSTDGRNWSNYTMFDPYDQAMYSYSGSTWTKMSANVTGASANRGYQKIDGKALSYDSYYLKSFDYTLSTSYDNIRYRYYAQTGSGLESPVYYFGTVEDEKVYGIKIDTLKSQLTITATATYNSAGLDQNSSQEALAAEYNTSIRNNSYSVASTATYSPRNAIILRIAIQRIGFSGVDVTVEDAQTGAVFKEFAIDYATFTEEGGTAGTVYRYYIITENGETIQVVKSKSVMGQPNKGISADDKDVYVRKDSTTPIVYIKNISGTKALNWGWDSKYNLYISGREFWYVSALTIDFGVGIVEENEFVDMDSYSGFTISYQADNGSWINVQTNTPKTLVLNGIDIIDGSSYKFKIESGAGLSYTLGGDVLNNRDVKITTIKYGQNTTSDITTAITGVTSTTPRTAHIVNGAAGDFDDGSFTYVFYVDSNNYSYNYSGAVYVGKSGNNDLFDTNTNKLMSYRLLKAVGIEGNAVSYVEIPISEANQFHRGDYIKLAYRANYDGETEENPYNYFQNRSVSSTYKYVEDEEGNEVRVSDRVIVYNEVNDWFNELSNENETKQLEKNGIVNIQFESSNVDVISYFIAEVHIEYGKDVFYAQTSPEWQTTGQGKYEYLENGAYRIIDLSLEYKYFKKGSTTPITAAVMNGGKYNQYSEYTIDIGAYYVKSNVERGTGDFRVSRRTEDKDFVVQYFEPDENNYRYINDATDFYFLNASFYVLRDDGTLNPTPASYLASSMKYKLTDDINPYVGVLTHDRMWVTSSERYNLVDEETGMYMYDNDGNIITEDLIRQTVRFAYTMNEQTVESAIYGVFAGEFDGQNHTITVKAPNGATNRTITTGFGLFNAVSGTVGSFSLNFSGKLEVNAQAAAEIGLVAINLTGTVDNVSVAADVELKQLPATSKFGGVAAVASGTGTIGQYGNVFTDVRVTNNGFALDNVSVSAVVAEANNGTKFDSVYAFGEVELYNVTNVKAGMLYGRIVSGTINANNVVYLKNNVFINSAVVKLESNTTTNAQMSAAIEGEEFDTFIRYEQETAGAENIRTYILKRLYRDFGYVYSKQNESEFGLGTVSSPLIIGTYEQLLTINSYMVVNYLFDRNTVLDMSAYRTSIAVTKVFGASISTVEGYLVLTGMYENSNVSENGYAGLLGNLNGKVENILFRDVAIDVTYTKDAEFFAGVVAGRAYEDAVVNNVLTYGSMKIVAENATANVGGIIGASYGAKVNDVFSMTTVAITGTIVNAGGVAGSVENITLPSGTEGSIFVLGRVEATGEMPTAGTAIGLLKQGTITGGNKVYSVKDNLYINGNVVTALPVGSQNETYGMTTESYDFNSAMKAETFGNGLSISRIFALGYYALSGEGDSNTPFTVSNERQFGYINLALYANYAIDKDIEFTDFNTIGEGLVFSGRLSGVVADNISAEEGTVISIVNVTKPFIYHNKGEVTNLGLSVNSTMTVGNGETFKYGAVAIINEGTIKDLTVSGNVTIISESEDTTLYVSGFVAESNGGRIYVENSRVFTSISALNISVTGGGIAYVGGYTAIVKGGNPQFNYGLAKGTIDVNGVKTTYVGLLIGAVVGNEIWALGEAASMENTYDITVDGVVLEKYEYDVDGTTIIGPKDENLCGVHFGD